jgi:hypothetical protein
MVYFCKSDCVGKKAKVNVLNFAFFSLGWTPESSQMQTRYNGLKMPFPAFRISSPLHSFFLQPYLPDAHFFSSQLTPYLYRGRSRIEKIRYLCPL